MSSINQISSVTTNTLQANTVNSTPSTKAEEKEKTTIKDEAAAVYEPGNNGEAAASTSSSKNKTYKTDTVTISQLMADAEARTAQLRSIVEKLIMGQNKSFSIANDDDYWKFLASGDFEVDEATKAQAKEDISDDGYWGVEQTSDRIVDFAIALSGGDVDKADELLEAFKEGYKQAEKTWGKELPEISKKTYEAVENKFAQWKEGTYVSGSTKAAETADTTTE